jgi:hypothetical protein
MVKLAMVNNENGQRVRKRELLPQAGPGADEMVRWRLTHFRKQSFEPPGVCKPRSGLRGWNDGDHLIRSNPAEMTCEMQVMM